MKNTKKIQNIHTVAELKEAGYHVKITHFRYTQDQIDVLKRLSQVVGYNAISNASYLSVFAKAMKFEPIAVNNSNRREAGPLGGVTQVEILDGEDGVFGQSFCNLMDNYNKKIGITKALHRAIKQYNQNLEDSIPF